MENYGCYEKWSCQVECIADKFKSCPPTKFDTIVILPMEYVQIIPGNDATRCSGPRVTLCCATIYSMGTSKSYFFNFLL